MSVLLAIAATALTVEYALVSAGVFVRTHYPSEWGLFVSITVIPISVALTLFIHTQIKRQIKKMEMQDEED